MNTTTGEMCHNDPTTINDVVICPHEKLCSWCNTNTVVANQNTCTSLYCIAGNAYINYINSEE